MHPAADPTAYEAWSLAAQWVGSLAALGGVAVAVVFGIITLGNHRRSKDTQERATMIAALDDPNQPQSLLSENRETGRVTLTVLPNGGERWLLVNEGPDVAFSVRIAGLTSQDNHRLTEVASDPSSLGPGEAKEFVLVSRLTLSGPANIRVSYRLEAGGPELHRVLVVPAP